METPSRQLLCSFHKSSRFFQYFLTFSSNILLALDPAISASQRSPSFFCGKWYLKSKSWSYMCPLLSLILSFSSHVFQPWNPHQKKGRRMELCLVGVQHICLEWLQIHFLQFYCFQGETITSFRACHQFSGIFNFIIQLRRPRDGI